jgi:hypothetical protein
MVSIIVANANGEEVRDLLFTEYDFEVGDFENSYLITCNSSEWETIADGSRLYIPQTEYGGLFKRLEVDTKKGTVAAGGYTWRGMLQNKIIVPPSGQDYATDSGELNAVIGARPETIVDKDQWGIAVVGDNLTIGAGAKIAPKAMISENVEGVE